MSTSDQCRRRVGRGSRESGSQADGSPGSSRSVSRGGVSRGGVSPDGFSLDDAGSGRPATLSAVAIIPARFGAQRMPGKPLLDLLGVPMVVRVARRTAMARGVARVVVATDDERIRSVVSGAGIEVVMTPSDCRSGSDRVAAALEMLSCDAEIVVNVQGDEPLIDPEDIEVLVEAARGHRDGITTLVRPLTDKDDFLNPNAVKAVVAADGRALYFSRAPVPSGADVGSSIESRRPRLHVGLYAYPQPILRAFVALPPSRLEGLERLEQLRALEAGIPVFAVESVSHQLSFGVDTPEDAAAVRRILETLEMGRARGADSPSGAKE